MQINQEEWTKQLVSIAEKEWYAIGFVRNTYSDGSISYSLKKNIELWITSSNSEFSIGFDDKNGNCTWHTHMSLFGANTINEQTDELMNQIGNILNDKVEIGFSAKHGYFVS